MSGYVKEVVVCDPRRNKLLGGGSKADKPDARKLAELLRAGLLRPVYHGHEATRELKELVRGYETLSADTQRMMVRIQGIYRAHGIRTPGFGVYPLSAETAGAMVAAAHRAWNTTACELVI